MKVRIAPLVRAKVLNKLLVPHEGMATWLVQVFKKPHRGGFCQDKHWDLKHPVIPPFQHQENPLFNILFNTDVGQVFMLGLLEPCREDCSSLFMLPLLAPELPHGSNTDCYDPSGFNHHQVFAHQCT